ncbi:hypothetical protein IAT40_001942 [Kwoniella sp. CBS 6097]
MTRSITASPDTPVVSAKAECPPELVDRLYPVPVPLPVLTIFTGRMGKHHLPVFEGAPRPVSEVLQEAVLLAVRLAEQLILSPMGVQAACEILSGSTEPDARVEIAVHRVLHRERFVVVLLQDSLHEQAGYHARPAWGNERTPIMERTLFIQQWYFDRMVEASERAKGAKEEWMRHSFLAATVVIHQVIHAMRRKVYLLLKPYGLEVPYQTPSLCPTAGAYIEGAGGWEFETRLLQGRLDGLWRTAKNPSLQNSVSSLASLEAEDQDEDWDRVLPTMRAPIEVKTEPIAFLAIARGEARYQIAPEWLEELHSAFEKGDISRISFPPAICPEPIDRGGHQPCLSTKKGSGSRYQACRISRARGIDRYGTGSYLDYHCYIGSDGGGVESDTSCMG